MKPWTLSRDNERDLAFTGEQIAEVSTSPDSAHPDYSGSAGRWMVLRLYRTKGGKLVAQRVGMTRRDGERDRFEARVCDTEAEVCAFLGHSKLAKELYAEANITDAEEVE